ncbi:MAG TPA: DUF2796 domain-containing protein [Azoarcus sp.]|nr:DUF2796 domain-containing protein [Azoarcus sp.]
MVIKPVFAALALAWAVSSPAQSDQEHEHGVADLRIAAEGETLLIEFRSPLINLVGFEREPGDEEEREKLTDLTSRLESPEGLVTLPEAAKCELAGVEQETPGGMEDHQDGDHHAHHDSEIHHDAWLEWTFTCAQPEALDSVEISVIDAFPEIKTLRVETSGSNGQASERITEPQTSIEL